MDKEFEALEEIGNIDLGDNPYKKFDTNKLKNVYGVEFATLYKAITELKTIKESNPSEALETIANTGICNVYANTILDYCQLEYDTVKQELLKAQELKKENAEYKEVLRIIKEKPQAELSLIQLGEIKTYEEYLDRTQQWEGIYWDMIYTEEEFDLLNHYFGKNIQKR